MVKLGKIYSRIRIMNIEMMGVTFARQAIDKTDYLVSRIKDNDRDPSWDGEVEVYRKASDIHSKNDLILKVPVQVKGHKENNLKKKAVKYSVELSDLRNYLNAGGTVFLVVYVDDEGENSQIYYNSLMPFELRKLITRYGEQKTKQIELTALPKKKDDIADVFLFAAAHMKKQKPAVTCDLLSVDELMKTGQLKGFEFGYTRVPGVEKDPFEYLFNHGTYIYAKLPFGLELPIEHVVNLDSVGTSIELPVVAKGQVFYSDYDIIRRKNTVEIKLGQSTKLVTFLETHQNKFSFTASGTLSERIRDIDFMIHALEAGSFTLGGVVFPFDKLRIEDVDIKIQQNKEYLAWLKAIDAMFKQLGVSEDLDYEKLTPADDEVLKKLVPSIPKNQLVEWPELNESFPDITIANITIKLCVLPDDTRKTYRRIFGYTNAPVRFCVKNDAGEEIEVSYYVCLRKESMLKCSNIDYQSISQQIQTIPLSEEYSNTLTNLLLEILLAYDESGDTRQDILSCALELAEWLRNNDVHTDKNRLDINYYQTIKRSRELAPKEIQALLSIIEGNPTGEDVYVGVYLLLEDFESAQAHFGNLHTTEQEKFMKYPVTRFFLTNKKSGTVR